MPAFGNKGGIYKKISIKSLLKSIFILSKIHVSVLRVPKIIAEIKNGNALPRRVPKIVANMKNGNALPSRVPKIVADMKNGNALPSRVLGPITGTQNALPWRVLGPITGTQSALPSRVPEFFGNKGRGTQPLSRVSKFFAKLIVWRMPEV